MTHIEFYDVYSVVTLIGALQTLLFTMWFKHAIGPQSIEFYFTLASGCTIALCGVLLHTMSKANRKDGLSRKFWETLGYYNRDST